MRIPANPVMQQLYPQKPSVSQTPIIRFGQEKENKADKPEGGFWGWWHRNIYNPKTFKRPYPVAPVMEFSTMINRNFFLSPHGVTKVKSIDLPKADLARLKSVIQPKNAVFMGPNHPEFFTDWMIDKEISARVAPRMASWADSGITNNFMGFGLRAVFNTFWRMNNLIGNVSKGGGEDYSIEWAAKGHGVLLHPEGTVHWTGDKVQRIFDGIAAMPLKLAVTNAQAGKEQKIYSQPLVWKLEFIGDVTQGLNEEIDTVAQLVKVPVNPKATMAERFFELQRGILAKAEKKSGLPKELRKEPVSNANFFDRQEQLFNYLRDDLESRYGVQQGEGKTRVHYISKAIKGSKGFSREQTGSDLKKADTMHSLMGFTREIYNKPHLTQEHIAESLKRILSKVGSVLQQNMPVPVGQRIAHIRVPEAVEVSQYVAEDGTVSVTIPELLKTIQERMQNALDDINREIAPNVSQYQVANAFYRPTSSTTEAPVASPESPAGQ